MNCPNCKKPAVKNENVLTCDVCGSFEIAADGTATPCQTPAKPIEQKPAEPVTTEKPVETLEVKIPAKKKSGLNIRITFDDE